MFLDIFMQRNTSPSHFTKYILASPLYILKKTLDALNPDIFKHHRELRREMSHPLPS